VRAAVVADVFVIALRDRLAAGTVTATQQELEVFDLSTLNRPTADSCIRACTSTPPTEVGPRHARGELYPILNFFAAALALPPPAFTPQTRNT
jgi:hypothetical protein